MSQQYGGFYSKQEQEDYQTTQITNPNRVGSGFINLGPQQRFAQPQAAANWQTGGALGGGGGAAPHQVAQIWDAPAAPPTAPPPRPPQPQAFSQPPAHNSFGQPPPQQGVNELFNSFGIDPNQQAAAAARAAAQAKPFTMSQPPMNMPPAPASVQQPFMNGNHAAGGAPPPQPGSSLMSMLGNSAMPPPQQQQGLNPNFSALGNGIVPQANRMQAAFSSNPPVHPMPPVRPVNQPNAPFNAGGQNSYRAQAPAAPPPAPKTLSSAADYAAAAQQWKPPPARGSASTQSVSRKAESQTTASGPASPGARTADSRGGTPRVTEARVEEWECRRCTFLNNGSLWECEMCGFERPGKSEQQAAAVALQRSAAPADPGWQTASKERKPSTAANQQAAAAGKSKAQNKNEKRRAKKRSDE